MVDVPMFFENARLCNRVMGVSLPSRGEDTTPIIRWISKKLKNDSSMRLDGKWFLQ